MKFETDNLCKYLAERYPREFAAWLLKVPLAAVKSIRVLKTELSLEPIRADSLLLLRLLREILHLEFQVEPDSEPPLDIRMLDYWVREYRLYRLPIRQFVLLLKKTRRKVPNELRVGNTYHRFEVINVWEQDPTPFLNTPALLPLAPLAYSPRPVELLEEAASRIELIESPPMRREIATCMHMLAGVRFGEKLVNNFIREEIMRESVTYKRVVEKGKQEGLIEGHVAGRVEGRLEGRLEGRVEGRTEEARNLVSIFLSGRFGKLPDELRERISRLSLSELEELAQASPQFQRAADLARWLKIREH